MAKVKTPIISLSASGSLGGSTTFQENHSLTIVRAKPLPSQPDTLPQIYQRWDFQDYIIQWHNLTQTQKDSYRAAASRNHSTPYAEFLKGKLADLPDIVARWRLDERTGTTAFDSSRNSNHLTIVGPTHVTGIIDHCLHFDGIDDYCRITTRPPFAFTDSFTLSCKAYLESFDDYPHLISTQNNVFTGYTLNVGENHKLYFRVNGLNPPLAGTDAIVTLDSWHTYHAVYDREEGEMRIYYDGVLAKTQAVTGTPIVPAHDFYLGRYAAANSEHWTGSIDEVEINGEVRSSENILRDSQRRYP